MNALPDARALILSMFNLPSCPGCGADCDFPEDTKDGHAADCPLSAWLCLYPEQQVPVVRHGDHLHPQLLAPRGYDLAQAGQAICPVCWRGWDLAGQPLAGSCCAICSAEDVVVSVAQPKPSRHKHSSRTLEAPPPPHASGGGSPPADCPREGGLSRSPEPTTYDPADPLRTAAPCKRCGALPSAHPGNCGGFAPDYARQGRDAERARGEEGPLSRLCVSCGLWDAALDGGGLCDECHENEGL